MNGKECAPHFQAELRDKVPKVFRASLKQYAIISCKMRTILSQNHVLQKYLEKENTPKSKRKI